MRCAHPSQHVRDGEEEPEQRPRDVLHAQQGELHPQHHDALGHRTRDLKWSHSVRCQLSCGLRVDQVNQGLLPDDYLGELPRQRSHVCHDDLLHLHQGRRPEHQRSPRRQASRTCKLPPYR